MGSPLGNPISGSPPPVLIFDSSHPPYLWAGILSRHFASLLLFGFLSPSLQMILPEADAPGVVLASSNWRIIEIATGFCLKQAGSSVSSVSTTACMISGMI